MLQTVLTDQGAQFVSEIFRSMLEQYNMKHLTSTAYNPTGNSIVERVNQEIGKELWIIPDMPTKTALRKIEIAHNCTYHISIGMCPNEAHTPNNATMNDEQQAEIRTLVNYHAKLSDSTKSDQITKRLTPSMTGQNVWLKRYPITDKLQPRWNDPYPILKVGPEGRPAP